MSDVDRFLAELLNPASGGIIVAPEVLPEVEENTTEEVEEPTDQAGNAVEYTKHAPAIVSVEQCQPKPRDYCAKTTKDGRWSCTREKGHDGLHEAGIGYPRVAATWPVEAETIQACGQTYDGHTCPLPAGHNSPHSSSNGGTMWLHNQITITPEQLKALKIASADDKNTPQPLETLTQGTIFQWGPGVAVELGLYRNSPKICLGNDNDVLKYQQGKNGQPKKQPHRDGLTWIPATWGSPILPGKEDK